MSSGTASSLSFETRRDASRQPADGNGAAPIVELRDVHKSFGAQHVLSGLSVRIARGRTTVIIGRSGTGKSVLLQHVVGLIRPDRGEVFVEGRRISHLAERDLVDIRREISFVFQLNALFDSMTVGQNVAFPMVESGRARHMSAARLRELVRTRLDLVGMAGFEHKRPAELSGGEKKRVALARAIAVEPPPKVILYDEPTAGLDPQRSDVINRLIRRLQDDFQVTSIVVTHDMRSAATVGDRILMLWNGRFIADGTLLELASVKDEHVRRFLEGHAEPSDIIETPI